MTKQITTRQITIDAMPVRLSEDSHEFTVQLRDPGIIRCVGWTLEQRLVMTRGEPELDEVLAMFIEFAPNGPMRNRRFVVMATGQLLGVPDGKALAFVGTAISGRTGRIAHVFEIRDVA